MDYRYYDVEDFVADAYFSRWVHQPDDETNVFWEQWITEHPEKQDTVAQATSILRFLNFRGEEVTPEEQQTVKRRVMQQVGAASPRPGHSSLRWRYLSVAAAFLLLLTSASIIWWNAAGPLNQRTTSFGEQQDIILPDGSQIKLNANSRLEYSESWADDRPREVWLEGEAFFQVVEQPEATDGRFIVHTPELDVEVLGTSFNVQTRHGESQVVLNTGKVKLQPLDQARDRSEIILEPGEMATLRQHRLVRTQVDPQVYSSWKDNRLFFENESIRRIAQRLRDTYGYQVTVDNPDWLDYTFTGSCPANDISILLLALSESFHLKVTQDGQHIRIQRPDHIPYSQ